MVGTVCPTASCPRKTCSSMFTICSFEGLSSGLEHVLKAKLSVTVIIIVVVIIFFTFFKQYFKIVFKETVFQHTCECSKPSRNSKKTAAAAAAKKSHFCTSCVLFYCPRLDTVVSDLHHRKKIVIKRTVKLNFCPANCFIPFSRAFFRILFLCVELRLMFPANCFIPFFGIVSFVSSQGWCFFIWVTLWNGWVWVWSKIQSRRTWRQHECPRGKSGEPAATSEPSPNPSELGLQTCQWTPSTLYPEQPKLVSPNTAPYFHKVILNLFLKGTNPSFYPEKARVGSVEFQLPSLKEPVLKPYFCTLKGGDFKECYLALSLSCKYKKNSFSRWISLWNGKDFSV